MCDLPGPGMEPMSSALAGRFFTTELPGKPPSRVFFKSMHLKFMQMVLCSELLLAIFIQCFVFCPCHTALRYLWLLACNCSMPPHILLTRCIMLDTLFFSFKSFPGQTGFEEHSHSHHIPLWARWTFFYPPKVLFQCIWGQAQII